MDELSTQLATQIRQDYPEWRISNFAVAGSGIECLVCRADTARFGPIAIRTPWHRWISNDNDPHLDSRDMLRQESVIASHLARYDIAVATPYHLHWAENGLDYAVSAFLENDQSEPNPYAFGQLIRQIHQCAIPPVTLVAQGQTALSHTIADRLTQRAKVLTRLTDVKIDLPEMAALEPALAPLDGPAQSLLHMDARPANLLTFRGNIAAMIDWSNAVIGDPAFELARIAEYGHLDEAFLAGYGNATPFAHLPRQTALLYRLDTALMLAIVFLSEAPNPKLATKQLKRVSALDRALADEI